MRKSFILSAAAMLSVVFASLGHATSASALERSSAPVEEKSEAAGSAGIVLIVGGIVAAIAAIAAFSGGGEEDRPVSP